MSLPLSFLLQLTPAVEKLHRKLNDSQGYDHFFFFLLFTINKKVTWKSTKLKTERKGKQSRETKSRSNKENWQNRQKGCSAAWLTHMGVSTD